MAKKEIQLKKTFTSNCKSIAKWIKSHAEAINVESMSINVPLSPALLEMVLWDGLGWILYRNGINRELRDYSWFDDDWTEHYLNVDYVEFDDDGKLQFMLSENRIYIK